MREKPDIFFIGHGANPCVCHPHLLSSPYKGEEVLKKSAFLARTIPSVWSEKANIQLPTSSLSSEMISHAIWHYHRFCLSFREGPGEYLISRARKGLRDYRRQQARKCSKKHALSLPKGPSSPKPCRREGREWLVRS